MPGVFDSPIFTQLLVDFEVNGCKPVIDERGNKSTTKGKLQRVRFKVNRPSSFDDQERQGGISSQRVEAYCLNPTSLPKTINVGHAGIGVLANTDIEQGLEQIAELEALETPLIKLLEPTCVDPPPYRRHYNVRINNILFSSVAPVVDSILGQKVILELIGRSEYGTGA